MTVLTHALHAVCRSGDTAMAETLVRSLSEKDLKSVVNRPLGSKDYVPLNNAVYYGSVNIVKILLANGADPNYTNSHGESLDDTLQSGRDDMIAKLPSERIFIANTFEQCQRYIEERRRWLERVGTGPTTSTSARGCPPGAGGPGDRSVVAAVPAAADQGRRAGHALRAGARRGSGAQ